MGNKVNNVVEKDDDKYTAFESKEGESLYPHKFKSNLEHDIIEIKEENDNEEPVKNKKQSRLEKRLIKRRKDLRALRKELTMLHRDSITIVHGYCRDSLQNGYNDIPLDIINLMVDFVGDHFSYGKMKESAKEIIEFVNKTPDPFSDDMQGDNPWMQYDTAPFGVPFECIGLFMVLCCPCIAVVLILLFIGYIITFGFCCHGRGTEWIRYNCN